MEIVKRQRGRNIPFYFTITPKEYIEMKKADCEIDGKESADRRAAWHRQKKSRQLMAGTVRLYLGEIENRQRV